VYLSGVRVKFAFAYHRVSVLICRSFIEDVTKNNNYLFFPETLYMLAGPTTDWHWILKKKIFNDADLRYAAI